MINDKNDNEKSFACPECPYKSNVKANLNRHIETRHKRNGKQIDTKEIQKIMESPQTEREAKEPTTDEIDLEDYIKNTVNDLMVKNNLPIVKKLPKFDMTGSIPSFCIGGFLGFVLSNSLPMLIQSFMMMKKKTLMNPPMNPTPPQPVVVSKEPLSAPLMEA